MSSLFRFVTMCIFIGWPAFVLVADTVMTCLSGKFYISSPGYCLFISNKPRAKERNTRTLDVILFQVVRKILPKQKFYIWKINLQGTSFPLFYSRSNTFRSKWPSQWITTIPAGNYRLNILKYSLVSKVNVKQSRYRSGQALRVPGGWGYQISRQSAHEAGKVVSTTHRPRLPPRKYSWHSFLLEPESTPMAVVRPEGLWQRKIPVTPSGIEPATFRLVAQCLNQLRHRVPLTAEYKLRAKLYGYGHMQPKWEGGGLRMGGN